LQEFGALPRYVSEPKGNFPTRIPTVGNRLRRINERNVNVPGRASDAGLISQSAQAVRTFPAARA
jgi:hypothetical protein